MTTTPATSITYPTWTSINLSRNLNVVSGAITPTLNVNIMTGVSTFIGDANGVPQAPVFPVTPGSGFAGGTLDLSEIVTRADGTKLTVLALLDSIGMAVSVVPTTTPVVPAS